MNNPKVLTTTFKVATFAVALSLIASASHAAFVSLPSPTPEVPGALLGGLTSTGGGTVLAFRDSAFSNAFSSGTLRSFVVDRDPTAAVALDFYYQVVNATPVPDVLGDEQIFRIKTVGGFDSTSNPVLAAQTDVLTGLLAGASGISLGSYTTGGTLKPARTADRDEGSPASVGFEFPVAPGGIVADPANIASLQNSTFLVVRTNSSSFVNAIAQVSSADTSLVSTFAAVPEPSSILFGLGMFGVALTSRAKRRVSK